MSSRKEQRRERGKKYTQVLVFWCWAMGKDPRSKVKWMTLLLNSGGIAMEIRALLHRQRQSCGSSKISLNHGIDVLKGNPFSALFVLASQSPKGWAWALHHLPRMYLHRAETLSTEDRWPVVNNSLFTSCCIFFFSWASLVSWQKKVTWIARILLRLI